MAVPEAWPVPTMEALTVVPMGVPTAALLARAATATLTVVPMGVPTAALAARTVVPAVVPTAEQVAWAATAVQTAEPAAEPVAWAPRAEPPLVSVVTGAPMVALTAAPVATRPPVKGPR
jgi:hypothetical protein